MYRPRFWMGCSHLLVALMVVTTVSARSMHEQKKIDPDGAKRLEVEFNFSAGELRMDAIDSKTVADIDITYDDRQSDATVEYEVDGGVGRLFLESELKKKTSFDTDDNEWSVGLSSRYPMSMDLNLGASDAELELGGLQIEQFKIDVGAASCHIGFTEPNPVRMERFSVEAGACSIEMSDIGNANFESFELEGGVGSFDLDFRGDYTAESSIELEIGIGSADITLPRGIPVRIEVDRAPFLSSVEFHRGDVDEIDDDIYESADFESADVRIIMKIEVGLGSVDITWRR